MASLDLTPTIITRLGIGIADRERCLFRVRLLTHTIFRSLSQQTRPINWMIVHDARMHEDAREALADLLRPHPSFVAVARDPLTGMGPMTGDVLRRATPVMCRIDDDDLVALDYAERLEAALIGKQPPFAVTLANGFDACPEQGVIAPKRSPWLAHSFATLSGEELFSPYSVRHVRIGETAISRGGGCEVLDGPPAWVYVRRSTSNGLERRPTRFKGDRYTSVEMDHALIPFGAEAGWTAAYLDLLKNEPRVPPMQSVDGPNEQSRLEVKAHLLRLIKTETGDTRQALISAFYTI